MKTPASRGMLVALALALLSFGGLNGQTAGSDKMPWQSSAQANSGSAADSSKAADQVQFMDPAQVTVAAGKPAVVDLQFRVADGLHINSHDPHDANLIPTRMLVVDGAGLKTEKIDFPAGVDVALPFAPGQKLSVYSGQFSLQARIVAARGKHQWQAVLRYQACNLNQCMPPKKLPITVDVTAQ